MKDQSIVSQAAGLVEEKMEALGLSHRVDVAITYDPDSNKNIVRATTTEGEDRFNRRYLDLVSSRPLEAQVDIFMNFYEKRLPFLKASYHWQLEAVKNNVHPQMFKAWFDSKKVKASDMWKSNKELV
jgi:hypothetical protein